MADETQAAALEQDGLNSRLPKTAFVAHWFPKPSETFVFREVKGLWERGLPLIVFTLYGPLKKNLSPEMAAPGVPVERLGVRCLSSLGREVNYWRRERPGLVNRTMRTVLERKWRDLEQTGENIWAFWAGLALGRRCLEKGVGHIHAAWANGPATAAWVASLLTGIPFSFSARAVDIFPPDGALAEKMRAAVFVRTESRATPAHLLRQAPDCGAKIWTIHSPLTLEHTDLALLRLEPPFRLLAVGRMVRKKGFEFLIRACALLASQGLDFRLDLVGSGPCQRRLIGLTRELGLQKEIRFPGFVPHHRVGVYYRRADLLVAPSLVRSKGDRDGLPNVIVEALSHGLPVVATDVSGIREAVRHNETGILVERADPMELAKAVHRMVSDRDKAVEMGRRGRDLAGREFDPEINSRLLMKLFRTNSSMGRKHGDGWHD